MTSTVCCSDKWNYKLRQLTSRCCCRLLLLLMPLMLKSLLFFSLFINRIDSLPIELMQYCEMLWKDKMKELRFHSHHGIANTSLWNSSNGNSSNNNKNNCLKSIFGGVINVYLCSIHLRARVCVCLSASINNNNNPQQFHFNSISQLGWNVIERLRMSRNCLMQFGFDCGVSISRPSHFFFFTFGRIWWMWNDLFSLESTFTGFGRCN